MPLKDQTGSGRSTALFSSARSTLTSWVSTCCASLVRSTHGLVSAFFPLGRPFGTSRPNTLARGLRKRRLCVNLQRVCAFMPTPYMPTPHMPTNKISVRLCLRKQSKCYYDRLSESYYYITTNEYNKIRQVQK